MIRINWMYKNGSDKCIATDEGKKWIERLLIEVVKVTDNPARGS
jgi:hypothetical protein